MGFLDFILTDAELAVRYEKKGEYIKAAELYKKIKNFPKSAEMYEKSNDYANAAEMYELIEDFEKAGEMYLAEGDYIKSAESFGIGTLLWKFSAKANFFGITITDDAERIIAGADNGSIFCFSRDGKKLWESKIDDTITDIASTPDTLWTSTGSKEHNLYLFDRNGKLEWKKILGGSISCLFITENSITAGGEDKCVYNVGLDGKLRWNFVTGAPIKSVTTTPDGKFTFAGSSDGYLYALDSDGKLLWKFGAGKVIYSVSTLPLANIIALGSDDKGVYLIDGRGKLIWKYDTAGYVFDVSLTNSGKYILARSNDKKVYVFDSNGNLMIKFGTENNSYLSSASITPDGEYIVAGSDDGMIYFLNKAGKIRWKYQTGAAIWDLSITPDGEFIAIAPQNGQIQLLCRSFERRRAELYEKAGLFQKAGIVYENSNDYVKAGKMFAKMGNFYRAGKNFEKASDYQSASTYYEKALNDKSLPTNIHQDLFEKIAFLYENLKELKKSAEYYEKAKNYTKGYELYQQIGDYVKAEEMKQKLEMLKHPEVESPKPVDDSASKKIEVSSKSKDEIKSLSSEIVQGSPDDVFEKWVESAKSALEKKEINKSIDCLNKAEEKAEKEGVITYSPKKGMVSLSNDEVMEILSSVYQQIINIAGTEFESVRAFAHFKLGEFTMKRKDIDTSQQIDKALYDFWKCYEIQPEYPNLKDKIIYLCNQKLAYSPNDIDARYKLGKIHFDSRNIGHAIKEFQKAVIGSGNQLEKAKARRMLALCFLEQNFYKEALEEFKLVFENSIVDETNVKDFYIIGELYEKIGDLQSADETYSKILRFDFGYRDVSSKLENIRKNKKAKTEDKKTEAHKVVSLASTDTGAEDDKTVNVRSYRYQLINEIGRGGMGVVWKAQDTKLNRLVALKALPAHLKGNPQAKQRFLREAQSAAGLNHPNIVSIYDIVEQGDEEFIAMEYIEGKSLRQTLKEGKRLELEQIIEYVRKVAQALQVAHEAGVIHRDIKPDNLIITKTDEIKITDFGIAHIEESTITSDTTMIGTPFYMSPEQIKGKKVDRRTDIYSLGIVFYEMLTGKPPFTEGDIAYHHIHTVPLPPSMKASGVPKEIDPIVMKCIAKEPDERYQTTTELVEALDSIF